MGCCLSKKNPSPPNNVTPKPLQNDLKITTQKPHNNNVAPQIELHGKVPELELDQSEKNGVVEEEEEEDVKEVATAKKDVIQHRKSNDGLVSDSPDPGRKLMGEEEVDAILIQCGRLSNGNGNGNGNVGRYSGSKRSFDFDKENEGFGNGNVGEEGPRRRESRGSNRRRTASSRSRERVGEQRSGSKERNVGGQSSGRRFIRSPRRRSESPMSNGNGNVNVNGSTGSGNRVEKPGKLVSVPATVTSFSSLTTDTSASVNVNVNGNRILVRRNMGSPRSQSPAKGNQVSGNANGNGRSQSPSKGNQVSGNRRSESPAKGNQVSLSGNGRCQSPAKGNQMNGNGGGLQQPVLSRNRSRKREKSPFRRTPLNEIDLNSLPFQPLADKRPLNKVKEIEENKYPTETVSGKTAAHVVHRRTRSRGAEGYEVTKTNYCRVNDLHTPNHDQLNATEYETMVTPTELSGTETLKLPQTLMRSRSAIRSRDLDINLDALQTPTPTTNYTSLLQDIQKFHQKKNSNSNPSSNCESTPTTFPACLSKTHSILEAVADLNSATRVDPFVETEVKVVNNLMEPALRKYVTVRKRGTDINDEESSGSNSIVENGNQNWVSSTSWDPNSADSTDRWTSKTYSQDDEISPVALQRHAISDIGAMIEGSGSKFSRSGRHLQSAPPQQIGATWSRPVTAAST